MPQPIANADVFLEALYTVKRLGIRQKPAVLVDVSRRELVIEVSERDGIDVIQAGDVLELEIPLPLLYGVPQRYLHCLCHVDVVKSSDKGNRLEVTVDRMQFRDDVMPHLSKSGLKTLVM